MKKIEDYVIDRDIFENFEDQYLCYELACGIFGHDNVWMFDSPSLINVCREKGDRHPWPPVFQISFSPFPEQVRYFNRLSAPDARLLAKKLEMYTESRSKFDVIECEGDWLLPDPKFYKSE